MTAVGTMVIHSSHVNSQAAAVQTCPGLPPVAELTRRSEDMPCHRGAEMSDDPQTSVVIEVVKNLSNE